MKLSCYNTSFWYLLPNLKKNKIKSYIEEICNEIDGGEEEKKKISEYYKHLVIDRYGLKYTPPPIILKQNINIFNALDPLEN